MSDATTRLPYIDVVDSPVFVVDEVSGGSLANGVFNLTFSKVQYDHAGDGSAYRRPMFRLVIGQQSLTEAVEFIAGLMAQAEKGTGEAGPIQ